MHICDTHCFNPPVNCPTRITIGSTGDAATKKYLKARLGSYNLIRYDNDSNPIYEHSLKNGNFLYKAKVESRYTWMVS